MVGCLITLYSLNVPLYLNKIGVSSTNTERSNSQQFLFEYISAGVCSPDIQVRSTYEKFSYQWHISSFVSIRVVTTALSAIFNLFHKHHKLFVANGKKFTFPSNPNVRRMHSSTCDCERAGILYLENLLQERMFANINPPRHGK